MLSKATTVLATAAALSGTFSASAASLAPIKLKQKATGERVFVEATTGREVFFHGVNAIVKGAPYIPETEYFDIDISLSREDHEALADLGVNVYRLGSMWKGLEPTRGVYEENYLKKLEQIVTEAEEYGIYTLLDMHQDDFSEKFCGEGVPDWAAIPSPTSPSDDFPSPLHEPYTATSTIDGYPTRQDCALFNWPSYYNTQAVGSAFQNLYTNTDNLLDSWANFWITLVKRFNPISYPSILGIELINEPWAGDTVTNPKLLLPSYADQHMLQPAYDYLAQQIREISHDILIFFAAVTWDDIIPVGFTHAPGGEGEEYAGSAVFAYHYYEPPQLTEEIYFPTRIKDAQRLHVASMLTEFERSDPTNANSTDGFVETADAADKYLQSWAMWEYKTFCKETDESLSSDSQAAAFGSCKTGYGSHLLWSDDGTQNMDASRKLARTYPQAVAGSTESFRFDTATGDFQLVFSAAPASAATAIAPVPTVVFAHQALNYPNGMKVMITPPEAAEWRMSETNKNLIEIVTKEGTPEGTKIRVKIQRK